jgi:hypothetical protein
LAQAFDQRRDSLYARLDRLGRVELEDLGADREVRRLFADLAAPGWVRVRYDDDYADLLNGGRRSCRPNAPPNRSRRAAP